MNSTEQISDEQEVQEEAIEAGSIKNNEDMEAVTEQKEAESSELQDNDIEAGAENESVGFSMGMWEDNSK